MKPKIYVTGPFESLVWLRDGVWLCIAPAEIAIRAAVTGAFAKRGIAGTVDEVVRIESLRAKRDAYIASLPGHGGAICVTAQRVLPVTHMPPRRHTATIAPDARFSAEQAARLFERASRKTGIASTKCCKFVLPALHFVWQMRNARFSLPYIL